MINGFYRYLRDNLAPVFLYWKAADKAVLLATFILVEVLLHWCWLLFIWLNSAQVSPFVDVDLIPAVFAGCSFFILLFSLLTVKFLKLKSSSSQLFRYQLWLFIIYSLYISVVIKLVGQDSFVSGIALLGGTILAMMLIDRRIVWWGFLIQCALLIIYAIIPYCNFELPSLKRTILFTILYQQPEALEMKWWYAELASARLPELLPMQGQLFWRMCYLYFGLPKAIFIVYVMKRLLDVFDQNKANFQYQAEHDELTSLKNRRSIYDAMRQQICDNDNHSDMSIILIDLDHFKNINDVHGHLVGDEVLKWVAIQLDKHLPEGSSAGRYGGEEFLILLPNCSQDQAIGIAKKLQKHFAQSSINIENFKSLNITASFGIATLDLQRLKEARQDFKEQQRQALSATVIRTKVDDVLKRLISQADQALYQAKSLGRDQVQSEPVLMV